ncbi:TIGR03620 family F420-dependent LLM class oxidoreductase [Microbacterium sp. ASV49]|uniref:TIGR03620 family F420-dependent LLM class oxidoreductase n=1 Tax=Microbacterium candidum TaxID=3041922 RepID=A0ABT7MXT4_9MICO|nr:TIGR03620 family F420-dependent LLM class oxidoreductase [Microbacterium sp. ASV49]MDL9979272.1 TIGR03620 family F420-dependent LLM class oxidoreductase [Microbacterium sp. ASV49]
MTTWSERLGTVGVWRGFTQVDAGFARGIEAIGYGALWLGYSPTADLDAAELALDATDRLHVATGVVNIWKADAAELAASFHRIEAKHPGRLHLGIGTGHREATPERTRPLDAMRRYLDVLDAHDVPVGRRVISALGPRMLELAAERSAGTHPYLTVPGQTADQRAALGSGILVAPEQTVVLDPDRTSSREAARTFLGRYLGMSNYTNNMLRGGFTEADVALPGSDRLVDDIIAQGDAPSLAARVREHLDAGADHVCVQVVPVHGDVLPALAAVAGKLRLA